MDSKQENVYYVRLFNLFVFWKHFIGYVDRFQSSGIQN